jgi:hypothetical protein
MEARMKLRAALIIGCLALSLSATAQLITIPPAPTQQGNGDGAKPAGKPRIQPATKPTVAGASPKTPLLDPGAVFAGLTGFCWQSALEQGNTDTHCITAGFNGKLVMDVHKVRNSSQAVVYEGVTVYRPDPKSRSVSYDYTNSFGNVLKGQGWREGSAINFSSSLSQMAKPETTWKLNPDGYQVTQADPKAAKLQFRKTGPAPDGL